MAIIRYTKDATVRYAYLNIFPDQFKTEKEKKNESYIKNTMDYFSNKAYAEYIKNRDAITRNYNVVKGILDSKDFYEEPDVKSFTEILGANMDLPSHVKHYSIITTPLNELIGEVSKRPDTYRAKAFDDESKNAELEWKTGVLQEYVMNQAREKIMGELAMSGEELSEEDIEKKTFDKVKDELDDYTSVAEKWANHVLTASKVDFNMKEKSEDTFRDLNITGSEYYHLYEDNSKTGFNIVVSNPKNTWYLSTPDKKWISDPSGRAQGAYAAGTVEVMELSEIIESVPDLTKEEIDHLRSSLQDYGLINVRESNLGNANAAEGIDSIQYDTFDPLVLQTRMLIESEMKDNSDGLKDFLGLTSNVSSFGYKYVVVRSYWISKKKIGRVVYLDEMGNEQSTIVDENYKSKTIPTQLSLEWGWVNQWYQGIKIGPDIYHMKPFDLLPYCPIFGLNHEIKNTQLRGTVDMMIPFQVIYNVAVNQLFELLKKEIGNVASINIRRVPVPKDGDAQDALDIWEMEARERGIIFDDDSPENTKSPISNTSIAKNIDLTRTNEIQSRYNLAQQMKMECWELVGMSKQRMGSISSSETATGTNTAMQQSYAQTEPLFVAHEYLLGQVYQGIIDASLYVESNKENSTISYITSEGESAFVSVNGTDLQFRDLKVFLTNRPEDTQMFRELRDLSQAVIQNGGSLYEIVELYSTKSMRAMKKTFKDLRDRLIAEKEQAAQLQQQQLEQQQKQADNILQQNLQIHQSDQANNNYQNELERINRKEIAVINALRNNESATQDLDSNGVADALEIANLGVNRSKAENDYKTKMAEINSKTALGHAELAVKKEALQVDRENQKNDLQIAKENAKGRNKNNQKK